MKKTLNVNIASQAFTLDEDAYEVLRYYYDDIRLRLFEVDSKEVFEDVESRTADIFSENLSFPSQVVEVDLVRRAIAIIGSASSFGDKKYEKRSSENERDRAFGHKLYRSRKKIIGGVCSGVADYFGIDTMIVRLITFFSIFFGGAGLFIYLVMWVFVPLAPITNYEDRKSNGTDEEARL